MTTRRGRNITAVLGPMAVLLAPKCPLCLLPLLAAAGIAAPPGPVLDSIVALTAAGWGLLLFTLTRSTPLRVCGVLLAVLVVMGRLVGFAAITWIGVGLMIAVALAATATCRKNGGSACAGRSP